MGRIVSVTFCVIKHLGVAHPTPQAEIPESMQVLADDCSRTTDPSPTLAPAYRLDFNESKLVFRKDDNVLQAFFRYIRTRKSMRPLRSCSSV